MIRITQLYRDAVSVANHLAAGGNDAGAATVRQFADHSRTLLQRHGAVRRDLLTHLEMANATISTLRDRVRTLTDEVTQEKAARRAEIPRDVLVRIVRAAYESGQLSGGESAELLGEPVQAFLGRRWRVTDADKRITSLENEVRRLTAGIRAIAQYGGHGRAAQAQSLLDAKEDA